VEGFEKIYSDDGEGMYIYRIKGIEKTPPAREISVVFRMDDYSNLSSLEFSKSKS